LLAAGLVEIAILLVAAVLVVCVIRRHDLFLLEQHTQ
jgi:hypothetical protein